MNKQRKFIYSLVFVCNDILMTIAALVLAVTIRRDYWPIQNRPIQAADYYSITYLIIITYIFTYYIFSLYRNEAEKPFYRDYGRIVAANVAGAFILMSFSFAFKGGELLSRSALLLFIMINILLSVISRRVVGKTIFKKFSKLLGTRNVLIIGSGNLGYEFLQKITRYKEWGYNILGFLDTSPDSMDFSEIAAVGMEGQICYQTEDNTRVKALNERICSGKRGDRRLAKEVNYLGRIEDLQDTAVKYHVDEVIIALPYEKYYYMREIIDFCDKEGIRIRIVPGYYEYLQVSTRVEDLDGLPILNIREVPLDMLINKMIKRSFDMAFALVGLIFFSPVMAAVAIGVKLSSPGPVLYRQERVGVNNRTFMMLKFRSMRIQTKEEEKAQWTTANDPRKTKFGSFIRKTSLDELPQLFNVLKGDMSIVGPRPERPFWVDKFKEEIPDYMLRHYIKSGITGWAQVNGWRGDTSIEERIKCDTYYIYNWSLWLDIKIIFLTVFKGFVNKNAY